jgi:hypothetical protein
MAFSVEDGTGVTGANSFASVAEFDDYLGSHVSGADALAATTERKEQALQSASRIIDAAVLWKGIRKTPTQGLGWPRLYAEEVEFPFYGFGGWTSWGTGYRYYDSASVPKGVKDATCEMALEMMIADRTAEPEGKGLSSVTVGPISVDFDAADRPALFPQMVALTLRPFGQLLTTKSRYKTVRRV